MKTLFAIGDVHGKFTSVGNEESYRTLIARLPGNTIQVGDFGIFNGSDIQKLNRKVKPRDGYSDLFFRGNHDNPQLCSKQKNWAGDFGFLRGYPEVFFIAGAESCDKDLRKPGKEWWPDEELTTHQMSVCESIYRESKPDIVISHECPSMGYFYIHTNSAKHQDNRTASFLQKLWNIHQPKLWVHGHHHWAKTYFEGRTKFRSLAELEPFEINV